MFTKIIALDLVILLIATAVLAYCSVSLFTGVWVTVGYVLTAVAALLAVGHVVALVVPEVGDAITG